MTPHPIIRPLNPADLAAAKGVIDTVQLFPSDMLDAMTKAFLEGDTANHRWFAHDAGKVCAIAYAAPERMTSGTWNLLLLAVRAEQQKRGIGASLVRHVETALAVDGCRMLLAETSGLPAFEATRRFYRGIGYQEEARIRDFYQVNEDKIVFRKVLREGTD